MTPGRYWAICRACSYALWWPGPCRFQVTTRLENVPLGARPPPPAMSRSSSLEPAASFALALPCWLSFSDEAAALPPSLPPFPPPVTATPTPMTARAAATAVADRTARLRPFLPTLPAVRRAVLLAARSHDDSPSPVDFPVDFPVVLRGARPTSSHSVALRGADVVLRGAGHDVRDPSGMNASDADPRFRVDRRGSAGQPTRYGALFPPVAGEPRPSTEADDRLLAGSPPDPCPEGPTPRVAGKARKTCAGGVVPFRRSSVPSC